MWVLGSSIQSGGSRGQLGWTAVRGPRAAWCGVPGPGQLWPSWGRSCLFVDARPGPQPGQTQLRGLSCHLPNIPAQLEVAGQLAVFMGLREVPGTFSQRLEGMSIHAAAMLGAATWSGRWGGALSQPVAQPPTFEPPSPETDTQPQETARYMRQNVGFQDHSDSSSRILAALCSALPSLVICSQPPARQPPLSLPAHPMACWLHSIPRLSSTMRLHFHLQPSPLQSLASVSTDSCDTLQAPASHPDSLPDTLPTCSSSQLASSLPPLPSWPSSFLLFQEHASLHFPVPLQSWFPILSHILGKLSLVPQ